MDGRPHTFLPRNTVSGCDRSGPVGDPGLALDVVLRIWPGIGIPPFRFNKLMLP